MDIVKDQTDLLSAFNAHGVEYLVVGGHAVNAYTQARSTNDLDILIRSSEENAARVFNALASFGAPLAGLSPADFHGHPNEYFTTGNEPDRIDIFERIPGVVFDDSWDDAVKGVLLDVPVRFISRDHLISAKLASGRSRDIGDVEELRKFAKKQ